MTVGLCYCSNTTIAMALRLLCAAAKNWKNYSILSGHPKQCLRPENSITNLLKVQSPVVDSLRSIGFLNKSKPIQLIHNLIIVIQWKSFVLF